MKLIKEIKSKEGIVHFKRWQLLSTKWFSIYIHGIYKEDTDKHLHNHPWNIFTLLLWGSYTEKLETRTNLRKPLDFGYRNSEQFHKILKLHTKKVFTLAIVNKRKENEWGYLVDGNFIDNVKYRKLKNSGGI